MNSRPLRLARIGAAIVMSGCAAHASVESNARDAPVLFVDLQEAESSAYPAERIPRLAFFTEARYIARAAANVDSLVRYSPVLRIPLSETDTAIVTRLGEPIPWGRARIYGPYRWSEGSTAAAGDSMWASISAGSRGASGFLRRSSGEILSPYQIELLHDGLQVITRNDPRHPRLVAINERIRQARAERGDPPPRPVDRVDPNFPLTARAAPMTPATREWVGCYDLDFSAWAPPLGSDSLAYAVPPRIQLDSVAGGNQRFLADRWAARPAPGSPPAGDRVGSWIREPDGVVMAVWGNGFSGMGLRLTRQSDGIATGIAQTFSDNAGPERPSASVAARPVGCDTPMPPEHRSWRTYPRSVHLESGDSVTLGEPLTLPAQSWELLDRTIRISDRPAGIFRGAAEVRVDQGIIEEIVVSYPRWTDVEGLVSDLTRAIGPPTSEANPWLWTGRERNYISLSVSNSQAGERQVEVRLRKR